MKFQTHKLSTAIEELAKGGRSVSCPTEALLRELSED